MRTVLDDLDDEWTRLRDSPQLRAALQRWGSDASTGAELEERTDGRDPADANQLLHPLLANAADDPLAGLVALCLLRPSLHNTARRCYGLPADEAAAAVVAAAWEEVSRYPSRPRPDYIAATITRAIRRRALRALQRFTNASPAEPLNPERWTCSAGDEYDRVDDRDQLARAQRRARLPRDTMDLLYAHRGHRQPMSEIAAAAGLNSATVRQRANRAERAMRVALSTQ